MADSVNMQQTEYDITLATLITLHEEELSDVRSIIAQVKTLAAFD